MFGRWLVALLAAASAACGGGGGGATSSSAPAPAPTIAGFTPTEAAPGTRIALSGSALDRVQSATLNEVVLPIASRSANSLELEVPPSARSGRIELLDVDGARHRSAQTLVITTPLPAISALTPTRALWGSTLRIEGKALATAARVEFAGGAVAVPKSLGDAALETVVPDGARSGALAVLLADGTRATAPTPLEVIEPVRVDARAVFAATGADGTIAITGSGLAGVSTAAIGAATATIAARSNERLTLVVPGGQACAPVTLHAENQPAVPAGVWRGSGCPLRLAEVEFAQVLSQPSDDPYQRLVPGRSAWVRAFVVGEIAGQSAPSVRLRATAAGTTLGALTFSGPATLPQLSAGTELPASLRTDPQAGFSAALPSDWVRSDLEIAIEIDAEGRFGAPVSSTQRPRVGTDTSIDLVLVPVVSGPHAPQLPPLSEVLDEIERRLPVARHSVRVSERAPFALQTVTAGVLSAADWSAALSELEQLRRAEAPTKVYYGLVKPIAQLAATEGLSYVNSIDLPAPALAALGLDASRSRWPSILVHELGHLFGRPHAPCGIAGDPLYPYANGTLGITPLFDALLAQPVASAGLFDVMGYCGGQWFSDHNYRHVQAFLEALLPSVRSAQQADPARDLVLISGAIDAGGVRFAPPRGQRGRALVPPRGAYRLLIETATGTLQVPFDAVPIDHLQQEQHFFVTVPDPGPIERLQVMHGQRLLPAIN